MPPIRRYLRITPRSVLETRIYLDNPSDLHRWLLHPSTPTLPSVIEAVRPLILPKLREEAENARPGRKPSSGAPGARANQGKGKAKAGKGKGVKDVVVVKDEFEVSIFLTQTSSRHSILRKRKVVKGEEKEGVKRRVVGGRGSGGQVSLTQMGRDREDPVIVREESDDEKGAAFERMRDIPPVPAVKAEGSAEAGEGQAAIEVSDGEDGEGERTRESDDKKKMGFHTEYEGFAIYGRILCLVVKRLSGKAKEMPGGAGQAMLEEWIGTQVQREEEGGLGDG